MRSYVAVILLIVAALAACDRTPVTPTPEGPPAHPPVQNAPPVIQTVTAVVKTKAEVDTDVPVTAQVTDAETPIANLQFNWSANVGQFSGTGPSVTWRLPKGTAATPVDVRITLSVVEQYQNFDASGTPIISRNQVSASAAPFRADDSVAEISAITLHFLVDLFGNYSVSPEACVVDFWDGCRGKLDELNDIIDNRAKRVIFGTDATIGSITFNSDQTAADVEAPCQFHDKDAVTGVAANPAGTCSLTATYQQGRWWLCDSHFSTPGSQPTGLPRFFRQRN
jgi:hypothetical protein